jgi:hypothetical protein
MSGIDLVLQVGIFGNEERPAIDDDRLVIRIGRPFGSPK